MTSHAPTGRLLAPSFLPSAAVLELTYRCNQDCVFCSCPWFAPRSDYDIRPELQVGDWKRVLRNLASYGVTSFAFTGGEPLLKKGVLELLDFASKCVTQHIETEEGRLVSRPGPPVIHLLTNGRKVGIDILDQCASLDVQLSVSLPGLSSFAWHTGGADVRSPLSVLNEARKRGIRTVAGVTVTRGNLFELERTLETAVDAGADGLLLNRFLPGGRGIRFAENLSLGVDDIAEILDVADRVIERTGCTGSVGTELPRCVVDEDDYQHIAISTRCAAATSFFAVDPSGFVRVCNHSPIRLASVDEIARVKDDPYWRHFALKDTLPSSCTGCELSMGCDGGCREAAHAVCGDPLGTDPLLQARPGRGCSPT